MWVRDLIDTLASVLVWTLTERKNHSSENYTHFDCISFGSRQFRDSVGVVINENAYILIDAASFDDMFRLSQIGVDNLQQNKSLYSPLSNTILQLSVDRTFRAMQT